MKIDLFGFFTSVVGFGIAWFLWHAIIITGGHHVSIIKVFPDTIHVLEELVVIKTSITVLIRHCSGRG